jgi:hypothetical protein
MRAALSKVREDRPSAVDFGRVLDQYCVLHREPGSPERLQSHLAELFPDSYRPPTEPTPASGSTGTSTPSARSQPSLIRRILGLR